MAAFPVITIPGGKYDLFNGYVARNSYMLSGGRHVAKVAVLYPIVSIWAIVILRRQRQPALIEQSFHTPVLSGSHFDYDYVDEEVLCGRRGAYGGMIIGEKVRATILPPSQPLGEHIGKTGNVFRKLAARSLLDAPCPQRTLPGLAKSLLRLSASLARMPCRWADALKERAVSNCETMLPGASAFL